jgi:arabinoxylan arabinofuranohydrolase
MVRHITAADPDAHVWNREVWVYCSMDGNLQDYGEESWTYAYMDGYHVFSTTDMVNWVDHGEIFHSRDVPWGPPGWMWAPSAAWNGKFGAEAMYYLYYPHKDWSGTWRIGVATGPTPAGPFKDIGKPIDQVVGIDPLLFIDDDKQAYLYYNSANVVKMKDNLIEVAETPRKVEYGADAIPESMRFEEGSYMHKAGNLYYYSYSNWEAMNTTAYYGIGTSPYGPFTWKGALAGKKSGSQDHHSIIKFKGVWYYFYHMDTPRSEKKKLGWSGHRRIACYDKLFYNPDNSIRMMNPSYFIVNCGGDQYKAKDGTMYQWDMWASGSATSHNTAEITGTVDPVLYQTTRSGNAFAYAIPLVNGKYKIIMQFAETYHNAAGRRKFHINIEGKRIFSNIDVFAIVGKNKAFEMLQTVNVADNELNIEFTTVVDKAFISAMRITPTALYG